MLTVAIPTRGANQMRNSPRDPASTQRGRILSATTRQLLSTFLALASPLAVRSTEAQTTTTTCWTGTAYVQCTSNTMAPMPNGDSAILSGLGGLVNAIHARRARKAAERQQEAQQAAADSERTAAAFQKRADSARMANTSVWIRIQADSVSQTEVDTATMIRHGNLITLLAAVSQIRQEPGGQRVKAVMLLMDCASMRGRILSGGTYVMAQDSSPRMIDIVQPTPPDTWVPLGGPVDAALVQRFCGG
jgi:hypothetical protein